MTDYATIIALMAAILESGHGVGQLSHESYVKEAVELHKAAMKAVEPEE